MGARSSIDHITGWPSRRNSRPPGREQGGDDLGPATDVRQPAERADAGVDEVEGMRRRARSTASYTSASTKSTAVPAGCGQRRASSSAGGGEVQPGHRAPSRASDRVSVPMWHCRCTPRRPVEVAQPRAGRSAPRRSGTSGRRRSGRTRSRGRPRAPGPARPRAPGSSRSCARCRAGPAAESSGVTAVASPAQFPGRSRPGRARLYKPACHRAR